MLKRRNKEDGFTLVELMIVIAVIGILAVVLIPRLGGVKDSAKYAGVTTNAKSVEAYVIANIDRWNKNGLDAKDLIETQFKTKDVLVNPVVSGNAAIDFDIPRTTGEGTPVDNEKIKGLVVVSIDDLPATEPKEGYLEENGIVITAYGDSVEDIVYKSEVIKPN